MPQMSAKSCLKDVISHALGIKINEGKHSGVKLVLHAPNVQPRGICFHNTNIKCHGNEVPEGSRLL